MVSAEAAARAVGVVKTFGAGVTVVRALDGVDVDFGEGMFTAIMGPSGSGKSTLLHCLAGLEPVSAGSVYIGDTNLVDLSDAELTVLRRDRIGFVFQSFNLVPTLDAERNIKREYLDEVSRAYSHFFYHYKDTPLLVINTSDIDIVAQEDDLDDLIAQIRTMERGTRVYVPRHAR